MPSKIQLDENLQFLYICLQKSDLKTIDFAAVGEATNLKAPAARMRYTRLRRQIESGTLIGTHGTPFTSTSTFPSSTKKRKRNRCSPETKHDDSSDKLHRTDEKVGKKRYGDSKKGGAKGKEKGEEVMKLVKKEREERWSDFESDDASDEDSEDEVPLAKLRKAKIASQSFAKKMSDVVPLTSMGRVEGTPARELLPPFPSSVGLGFGIGVWNGGQEWRQQNGYPANSSKPRQ